MTSADLTPADRGLLDSLATICSDKDEDNWVRIRAACLILRGDFEDDPAE